MQPAIIPRFEVLSDEECLLLLGREPVGRIALTSGALPVVLPINFTLDHGTVVFATEPGLKLDAARAGAVACLEIDGIDRWAHSGWSVLATGRMNEITDPQRRARARELPVSPWAAPAAHNFVELSIDLLSGRRVNHHGRNQPST